MRTEWPEFTYELNRQRRPGLRSQRIYALVFFSGTTGLSADLRSDYIMNSSIAGIEEVRVCPRECAARRDECHLPWTWLSDAFTYAHSLLQVELSHSDIELLVPLSSTIFMFHSFSSLAAGTQSLRRARWHER